MIFDFELKILRQKLQANPGLRPRNAVRHYSTPPAPRDTDEWRHCRPPQKEFRFFHRICECRPAFPPRASTNPVCSRDRIRRALRDAVLATGCALFPKCFVRFRRPRATRLAISSLLALDCRLDSA